MEEQRLAEDLARGSASETEDSDSDPDPEDHPDRALPRHDRGGDAGEEGSYELYVTRPAGESDDNKQALLSMEMRAQHAVPDDVMVGEPAKLRNRKVSACARRKTLFSNSVFIIGDFCWCWRTL